MATESELDAALFASVGDKWAKVAFVLGRAAKATYLVFAEADDEYAILAERLEQLVATGAILARGDITQWTFCEVRRPGLDLQQALHELRAAAEPNGDDDGPKRA
jgi:hypothetical protein